MPAPGCALQPQFSPATRVFFCNLFCKKSELVENRGEQGDPSELGQGSRGGKEVGIVAKESAILVLGMPSGTALRSRLPLGAWNY